MFENLLLPLYCIFPQQKIIYKLKINFSLLSVIKDCVKTKQKNPQLLQNILDIFEIKVGPSLMLLLGYRKHSFQYKECSSLKVSHEV